MVAIWKSMSLYNNDETGLCGGFLGKVEQVRIALVADGHNTMNSTFISVPLKENNLRANSPNTEKFSGSCAKGDIGASKVVDSSF